jgi:hypothetical protein
MLKKCEVALEVATLESERMAHESNGSANLRVGRWLLRVQWGQKV